MIVVDSSVWVEILRDSKYTLSHFVQSKILEEQISYNGVILSELLQGAHDKKEYTKVLSGLKILTFREINFEIWNQVGQISFEMRKKGFKIPLTDCIISALCIHYQDQLLTLDKHFQFIAKAFPLSLIEN